VLRTRIPFFTTQMGKGTVAGGSNLYMGTAALSERDYVHEAIDRADLIIAIGHDTIEKPPFIMGEGGPQVIHVGYTPANVEEVYFPACRGRRRRRAEPRAAGRPARGQAAMPAACWACAGRHPGAHRRPRHRGPLPADAAAPRARCPAGDPEDGIVCLDNGMYKIWFARNYRTYVANTLLLDNALATMGAGLPSAMMAASCSIRSGACWRCAATAAS
jgi:acetolactate synthase-1/2/3 large subunit